VTDFGGRSRSFARVLSDSGGAALKEAAGVDEFDRINPDVRACGLGFQPASDFRLWRC
jgi:hypothetical protein